MTLKEKFNSLVPEEFGGMQEPILTECEKIADDYAIEFAEWFNRFVQYYDNVNGIRYYTYLHDLEVYTSLQLLEIFKKEK